MFEFARTLPKVNINIEDKSGSVECRQVVGSFMEPKLGEKVTYATYEVMRGKGLIGIHESYVRGKARIHGIDCFESVSSYINFNNDKKYEVISFDRIVDGHVQSLAYIEEYPDGCRDLYTFKDEHFLKHWANGENNSGMEISLPNRGIIIADEDKISVQDERPGLYDIVGRYKVEIDGRVFDAVRLVLIAAEQQVSDFFIGQDGREIMHRFFMPDEGYDNSQKERPYSTQFPEAYTIEVNQRRCICTKYVFPEYVF